jgi:hypothetical protein
MRCAQGRTLVGWQARRHRIEAKLRDRIAAMQSKGQGGARHFDNLFW